MDIEVENGVGVVIQETVCIKSSPNGGLNLENGDEIQIVDLAEDSPIESNEGDEYNLPGLESDSEDSRLLSKSDLLKSLSDIDNIVIKNNSSLMSTVGGMFMQQMNKSSLPNVSEDVQNCAPRENVAATINGTNPPRRPNNDEIDTPR